MRCGGTIVVVAVIVVVTAIVVIGLIVERVYGRDEAAGGWGLGVCVAAPPFPFLPSFLICFLVSGALHSDAVTSFVTEATMLACAGCFTRAYHRSASHANCSAVGQKR